MNPDLFKTPTSAVGPQGEPIFDIFQGGQKLNEQQFAGLGVNVNDIPIGQAPQGFASAFPTAEIKVDTNNAISNKALEAGTSKMDIQKLIADNMAQRNRLTEESISALRPTEREQQLQQQLIGLNRNEAESITRLGNQPILSSIAQGQQSQVQKLAAIERTALAQELGLQQANRQFQFDALKLRLDQAGADEDSLLKLDEITRQMEQDAIAKEDRLTERQSTLLNNLVSNYIGLSLTELDPASKTQVANAARALGIPLDAIANRLQVEKNKIAVERANADLERRVKEEQIRSAQASIAKIRADIASLGGGTTKPLSGDAAKVLTIAETMIPEVQKLQEAFRNNYKGALRGILAGTDRELVKLVDNVADKVGRLRSGGAINKDEETRFKKQIASMGDLIFGKQDEAISALDGLIVEAESVATGIAPNRTKQEDGGMLDLGDLNFKI